MDVTASAGGLSNLPRLNYNQRLQRETKSLRLPISVKMATGAVAGAFGTCVVFPIDLVKTRMQAGRSEPGAVARSIAAKDGLRGFYRGLGVNVAGCCPEKAIKLGANDFFRELAGEDQGPIPLWAEMASAAAAGACQCVASNPVEVVKVRLQMESALPAEQRLGTLGVMRSLGLTRMYQGWQATATRDVILSVMMFPLYANLKERLTEADGSCSKIALLGAGAVAGAVGAALSTPADVVKTRLQVHGGCEKYGSVLKCAQTICKEEGFRALLSGCTSRVCVVAPMFGMALFVFETQKKWMAGRQAT